MTKEYSFDEAAITIENPNGETLAIFDVSPTIECRWIAISNKAHSLLTVFGGNMEMLTFVAQEQIDGGVVGDAGSWLDEQVSGYGFESWNEFVADVQGESSESRDEVEFPVYYDSQGREHAEF